MAAVQTGLMKSLISTMLVIKQLVWNRATGFFLSDRLKLCVWSQSLENCDKKRIVWRWSRGTARDRKHWLWLLWAESRGRGTLTVLPCERASSGFRSACEPVSEKSAWVLRLNFELPVQEKRWLTEVGVAKVVLTWLWLQSCSLGCDGAQPLSWWLCLGAPDSPRMPEEVFLLL